MKEFGLPKLIFDTKGFFTVTFMKHVNENNGSSNEPINGENDPLNKTDGTINGTLNSNSQVLSLIQKQPGIRTNLISNQTAISISTFRWSLKELMDTNAIEYLGSKKTGRYYIKDNQK